MILSYVKQVLLDLDHVVKGYKIDYHTTSKYKQQGRVPLLSEAKKPNDISPAHHS